MADRFSGSYDVVIGAPTSVVAEYCSDPRNVFAGEFEFSDIVLSPEVVGTTARGQSKGAGHEEILIKYVEYVPEQRIVFEVHPKMTVPKVGWGIGFAVHVLTWRFAAVEGGTRLALEIVERDPPWWQRLLDVMGARSWAKLVRSRLGRIKAAVEENAPSAGRS